MPNLFSYVNTRLKKITHLVLGYLNVPKKLNHLLIPKVEVLNKNSTTSDTIVCIGE